MAGSVLSALYERLSVMSFYLMRIFPVKPKKIVFNSCGGRKFGDHAQYILEELHRQAPDTDIVWLKEADADYALPPYVRTAPYRRSVKRTYEMATAKVWVGTHNFSYYDRKRKNQYVIQTWHGGLGMKRTGFDHDIPGERNKTVRNNGKLPDLLVSNSDHLDRVFREGFLYRGEILKCGSPRNDIFFHENTELQKKVREYYQLPQEEKLLLYAPTFRPGQRSADWYGFDPEAAAEAMHERFGGSWRILMRWHPTLLDYGFSKDECAPPALNATAYPDMQELICAADACITDYSTCIFDAALRQIPCFTFAVDLEKFEKDWGLYYDMRSLPFPFAASVEELKQNILHWKEDMAKAGWEEFCRAQGVVETGHAAKDVVGRILQVMGGARV